MFLLNLYKKKNIVVAHVNYHKRSDSNIDENIVKDFCIKNNIPFELLSVKEKPKGNFQSWARDIRYNFFKEVYIKYKCKELVIGHHMDDFLETAIMQQKTGRTPRFFGIRKKKIINEMNINRPFISLYWKTQILNELKYKKIPYAIDSSNEELIFERNKIRHELSKKTLQEKKEIYKWFKGANKLLEKNFSKVDAAYKMWKNSKYKVELFRNTKMKNEVIYEFINDIFQNINLSSGKIESLIDFITSSNSGKKFILNKDYSIIKENGYVKKV